MSNPHTPVFARIVSALNAAAAPFQTMHHEPVYTSAQAAAVRGTSLSSGAKALVLKGDERFVLAVLPADRSLDSKALRKVIRGKRLRFATVDEVLALTGLTPGSIPPFGSLFELDTYCDETLADHESINFNAGSHTDSIQMPFAAYAAFEKPRMARFAGPPAAPIDDA